MGFDLGTLIPVATTVGGAMLGGPAGAAAGAVLGGTISGSLGQQQTNAQNLQIGQDQMAFQEKMSDSAHQREVADLKAAGLNPILSANGGGASTPAGAAPTMQNPEAGMASGFSNAINSAMAIKDFQMRSDLNSSQVENTDQDTENKKASQALIENQQASTAQDVQSKSLSNNILKQTMDSQIKKAKAEGDYSEINQIMGIINHGASSVNQLVNPIKLFGK